MSKIRKFFKMGIGEICYRISAKIYDAQSKKRLFAKKYLYDNRQKGFENLLIIVAGFQPYYWDQVFARVNKSRETFGESIDICVCVPEGIKGSKDDLRKRCEKLGWSYLYIHLDLLSQVQNTAIKLHPHAQWIYKIDEDIIVSEDYFCRLKHAYINADSKSYYPIGFMGPLLNINAACAPYFLKTVGAYDEFRAKYGEYRIKFQKEDDLIHKSKELAEFIWEKSVPFDEVAAGIYSKNKGVFVVSPVRYSIGAILFKRDYWEQIGFFKVGILGQMGLEEEQICGFSLVNFKPIFIALDVFAGHLGFYTQKETCRRFFEKHSDDIFLKIDSFEENDNVKSDKLLDTRRGGVKYDISIIIPTYKRPDFFEIALNSAINQDYQGEYEIVVVDNYDGEDKSPNYSVLESYKTKRNIVYYRNQRNLGMLGNWNRGVQLASAEYVTFCHDDDVLLSNCLSRLLTLQKQNGCKCILSKYNIIDENGVIVMPYNYPHKLIGVLKEKDHYSYSLYNQFVMSMGFGVGCLFNRDCMLSLGGYNKTFYPSADYALQASYTYYYGCVINNVPTFNYRVATNESSNIWDKFADADLIIRNSIIEELHGPKWLLRRILQANDRLSRISFATKWGGVSNNILRQKKLSDRIIMKLALMPNRLKRYC